MLLLFAIYALNLAVAYVRHERTVPEDIFGIWSWARFMAAQSLAPIYDIGALHRFQLALEPLYADLYFPFLYPPTYLLIVAPLGHLGYAAARVVWSIATTTAFAASVLGPAQRQRWCAFALLAPATIWCLITGQNGLLIGAIMIGGLRCARTRPIVGGTLLGLLSIKPHFLLLLPVALIASRSWRVLCSATITALVAALLSALAFGFALWPAWLNARTNTWNIVEEFIASNDNNVPTVFAALHHLDVAPAPALGGQIVAGLLAAVLLWTIWRRAPFSVGAIAAFPIATLLATPYAYIYDLPMMTGGLLLVLQQAEARKRPLASLEFALVVLGLALPLLMLGVSGTPLPLAAPLSMTLLCLLTWGATTETTGAGVI